MSRRADTLARMLELRGSAILRTDTPDRARAAMEAAVAGGFRFVEFTLTIPGALDLVREFSARDDLLVGAGTVLTPADAEAAAAAGARFLVSPVMDPEVIAAAHRLDCVAVPGCATPTEMLHADRAGAEFVKIFPAPAHVETFVRQVRGPLPHLRLFPTAGVGENNVVPVLAAGAAGVGFVASLFDPEDLAKDDFDTIRARAERFQALLRRA